MMLKYGEPKTAHAKQSQVSGARYPMVDMDVDFGKSSVSNFPRRSACVDFGTPCLVSDGQFGSLSKAVCSSNCS